MLLEAEPERAIGVGCENEWGSGSTAGDGWVGGVLLSCIVFDIGKTGCDIDL
jgi:hypothetical protein